eukprot:730213-Prymnesium_polylepis.1
MAVTRVVQIWQASRDTRRPNMAGGERARRARAGRRCGERRRGAPRAGSDGRYGGGGGGSTRGIT